GAPGALGRPGRYVGRQVANRLARPDPAQCNTAASRDVEHGAARRELAERGDRVVEEPRVGAEGEPPGHAGERLALDEEVVHRRPWVTGGPGCRRVDHYAARASASDRTTAS